MTPEVEALAVAAIRAARWVPEGPLVRGCVHDSGEAVRQAVRDALAAVSGGSAPLADRQPEVSAHPPAVPQ